MLEKTEDAITNVYNHDTQTPLGTKHRTKINKKQKTQHSHLERWIKRTHLKHDAFLTSAFVVQTIDFTEYQFHILYTDLKYSGSS